MEVNQSQPKAGQPLAEIFKAYDIRGVYPAEISEEIAYRVCKAVQLLTNAKKVIVGHDTRLSSPALAQSLVKGLTEQGVNVDLAGLVSTDAVYFSVGELGYDAGVVITASHNPKEYNGIKVLKSGAVALSGPDFKELVIKNEWPKIGVKGEVKEVDIIDEYVNFVLGLIDQSKIKPLKIAIDAGNGVVGPSIEKLFKNLPVKVLPLYFEPNGDFPNHLPNPLEEENTGELRKIVKKEKCDLGVAFDGDGDRVFFIDEKGNLIRGDLALLFLAKAVLEKNPGAKITYNLICSHAVPELIKEWGGQPIKTKVGHSFIKEVMKKEDAVFGGEISCHFFYKDNFYTESGLLSLLLFLETLSGLKRPLSEIIQSFEKYAHSPEINVKVADAQAVISKIKEKYQDAKIDLLDGVTVEFNEDHKTKTPVNEDNGEAMNRRAASGSWWFNVRPSNTEPLLRVTVEARNQEELKKRQEEVLRVINN